MGLKWDQRKCFSKNCWSEIHHVDVALLSNCKLAIDYQGCLAAAVHARPVDLYCAEQLTQGDMKIIASAAAWLHIID